MTILDVQIHKNSQNNWPTFPSNQARTDMSQSQVCIIITNNGNATTTIVQYLIEILEGYSWYHRTERHSIEFSEHSSARENKPWNISIGKPNLGTIRKLLVKKILHTSCVI